MKPQGNNTVSWPRARVTSILCIVLLFVVVSGVRSAAAESQTEAAQPESGNGAMDGGETEGSAPADARGGDGLFLRSLKGAERQRDRIGYGYVWLARGIDNFFTDEGNEDLVNESHLKLDLRHTLQEAGESVSDVRIKAKLDLPNTEDRVKLAFSSDQRQDESLEERIRPVSTGERIDRDRSTTELQIEPRSEWHRWKRRGSIGVRTRIPLVPYGRYRIKREWELSPLWRGELKQELWYFDDRGWGETTEVSFWRPLTDDLLFRLWGEIEFRDREDRFDFVEIASVLHHLSDRSNIEYRIGALGASQPGGRVNAYFYGLSYRRRVHEDWVFLSATPELFYPREEGWSAEPSFTVRLEVLFFE